MTHAETVAHHFYCSGLLALTVTGSLLALKLIDSLVKMAMWI